VGGNIEARNRGRIDVRRAVRIQLRQLEWRPTCVREREREMECMMNMLSRYCNRRHNPDSSVSIGLHPRIGASACLLTWEL
jgi:hypothetical protein